ncbi:ABC transporter ATP-binding protein [Azospirillum halopraeferens]|uniref:ABC transporter ATP-binding protein n=1 Tax=Azospirillum halopraeferens TaxID=34010 RepID=UPI0003F9E3B2|nr:ABC transporter ATP-binding protein [Azospirillum halopraeferens]
MDVSPTPAGRVHDRRLARLDPARAPRGDGFMAWMWFATGPYRGTLAAVGTVMLLRHSVAAAIPLFFSYFIAVVATGGMGFGEAVTTAAPYLVVFILYLGGIAVLFPQLATVDLAVRSLGLYALDRVISMDTAWHEDVASGAKGQKINKGRESFKTLLDSLFWSLLAQVGLFISLGVAVATLDVPPVFYLLYLLFGGSYVAVALLTLPPLRRRFDRVYAAVEVLFANVYDFLSSVTTIKIFTLERPILQRARAVELDGHDAGRRLFRYQALRWAGLNLTAGLWMIVIFLVALESATAGAMPLEAFTVVLMFTVGAWMRFEWLAYELNHIIEAYAGFRRLTDLLARARDAAEAESEAAGDRFTPARGAITLDGLSFAYKAGGDPVVTDLSLTIPAGQSVGLVGPSGAGKSTLLKLLLALYPPDSGRLLVDGRDVAGLEVRSYRRAFAVIPQEPAIFNMSLMDNIRLARPEAGDDEVIAAARAAHAHDFITAYPQGYDTLAGERGVVLSGGQRQRVAIARAVLRDAPIVILDEATSALDSETERLVQDSLDRLFRGRTVIAIAHRLSTLARFERIVVMDGGRIVEDGPHATLIEKAGLYARLWGLQAGARAAE